VVLVLVPQKAWAATAPTADDDMGGEDDLGHHGQCGRANDILQAPLRHHEGPGERGAPHRGGNLAAMARQGC
jgi:hypothetical protein